MDCVEAKSKMEPFASGRLGADDRARLEEHLQSCEGCRLEVELVRAMGSAPPKSAASTEDEWTIDRIFGSGGAGSRREPGGASSAAPPSADVTPASVDAPAPVDTPAPNAPDAGPSPAVVVEAPADADAATFEKVPTPPPPEIPATALEESESPLAATAPPAAAPPPTAEAPRPAGPDPEASFAGMQLESIQSSSIAEPKPKPGKAEVPASGSKQGSKRPRAGGGAPAKEDSWEFEPADAKPDSAPPEGSLFFAEEALTRQAGARKGKSSALRAILWSVGTVVGLGLLGLSLWIAFAVRQPSRSSAGAEPSTAASSPEASPPAAGTTDGAPTAVDQTSPEASSAADGGSSVGAPGTAVTPDAPAGPGAAAAPSGASGPAPKARVIEAASVPPGGVATLGTEKPAPPAPKPARTAPASPARSPSTTTQEPASPVRNPARVTANPAPAVTKSERAVPLGGSSAAEEADETPKPAPPAPTRAVEPRTPDVSTEAREPSPAAPPKNPPVVQSAPPATATEEPQATTPAPAAAERPIDRLHLATVTAAQNSDLDALRKLRDTWKGFVKSSVGPDRARGKRELADCLWNIQAITGKNSDKKDALLAYREYVLNAPAGGADARTVARMRQLEDALSDAR